jgi:hypothetical protein
MQASFGLQYQLLFEDFSMRRSQMELHQEWQTFRILRLSTLMKHFPKNWYTHSTAYSLVGVATNIVGILAASPQLTLLGSK